MTTQELTVLVQNSVLLTDAEKKYWLRNLPKMDKAQSERLASILVKAAKIPWTSQIEKCFTAITNGAKKISPQPIS